jgi:hypothetical protein
MGIAPVTVPCNPGRPNQGAADEEGRVLLVGPWVEAVREWLERADIKKGPDLPGDLPLGGGGREGAHAAVD